MLHLVTIPAYNIFLFHNSRPWRDLLNDDIQIKDRRREDIERKVPMVLPAVAADISTPVMDLFPTARRVLGREPEFEIIVHQGTPRVVDWIEEVISLVDQLVHHPALLGMPRIVRLNNTVDTLQTHIQRFRDIQAILRHIGPVSERAPAEQIAGAFQTIAAQYKSVFWDFLAYEAADEPEHSDQLFNAPEILEFLRQMGGLDAATYRHHALAGVDLHSIWNRGSQDLAMVLSELAGIQMTMVSSRAQGWHAQGPVLGRQYWAPPFLNGASSQRAMRVLMPD